MIQAPHEGMPQSNAIHYLSRPRIDRLLKEAFQKPLTTVVAGAGFGKTHAVSSALGTIGCKSAWMQLSELDNLISILWSRLVFAIAPHNSDLAMRLSALGYPDSPTSFYQLVRLLEGKMKYNRFVLVLDDFYTVNDRAVLNFFEKLITANIANLSIVLISRETPSLSLAGMLSKGLMERVTEDDLRFSQDEMAAYYQMQGIELDDSTISSLYGCTEGWILAIYLAGLSFRHGKGHKHNPISYAKIDIFKLIEEEIFRVASKELQKFLIRMSLIDIVPAELLKELARDMPGVLAEMANSSLLGWYDPHSDRYRIHPLFKEFLSERKEALSDEEIVKTHLTAAKWYHRHNHSEEAINHYLACGRYIEVFDIIVSIRKRIAKDTASSFIRMIEQAPAEVIKARPIIRVVKTLCLFSNNRIQDAQDELNRIRNEYEALPPTREHLAVLGEVYLVLAVISIVKQDLEFVTYFKKADQCLPDGSALIDNRIDIPEGINVTGVKNPIPGELKRYQDALFEAAPYIARVMNGCDCGMEYLCATDAAYMTGNIQNAEKYAYETIYLAQQQKQYEIEYVAYFYLIRIYVYKGNYKKIALILKQMREQIERLQNFDSMAIYDIIEGWFFVKIGQTSKVAQWIIREEETRKTLAPLILGREYWVRSECMLAEDRDLELLGFMKQSDDLYEKRGILYARIQNKITEAIIYHYQGNHRESMDALQAAYALSHANNLIIQYIEYGSKMRTVVKAAMQDKDCKIPKAWLENIHTKSSTYAKQLAQIVKGYSAETVQIKRDQIHLSKRELEVLSCLCRGLTREEIADTFNLSANTVRSIQQNIFNKLGAINSLDAVRIATMMNLV